MLKIITQKIAEGLRYRIAEKHRSAAIKVNIPTFQVE